MKATVEIDDALLRAAKRAALDRNGTLREVIEAALRRELTDSRRPKSLRLSTVKGNAPEWIGDRDQMWDWLDRHR